MQHHAVGLHVTSEPIAPPGPPAVTFHPLSLLRHLRRMRVDEVTRIDARFQRYGDLYCAPFLGEHLYVLRHPEHIHQVLVAQAHKFEKPSVGITARALRGVLGDGLLTSNGALWRRQRRLIQPAFHPERLQTYAKLVVSHTAALLDTWSDGQEIDASREAMRLTLRIVARTLFDTEVAADGERVAEAMQAFRNSFSRLAAVLPKWLATPAQRRAQQAVRELDTLIFRMIDAPHRPGATDLLSSLRSADQNGVRMERRQLRDELLTLFVAGHETTSHALSWTWHLLSQHPDIETALREEVRTVLGTRIPTLADLPRLTCTERVLSEAMRLYPPAYVLPRVAVDDAVVGGYHIPRGADVIVRVYHTHHDARWFPEPERFDPDRFLPERRRALHNCAYLPFGAGARACIGKHFAMMEAMLILACTAQRFSLDALAGQTVRRSMTLTLAPTPGVRLRARAR